MKVAVVGAGKFGLAIMQALIGGKNEVTVIDKNENKIRQVNDRYDIQTVCGNAVQVKVLEELGIKDYKLLIAATDEDEVNMIICRFAKELGCPQTIARVRDPEHLEQSKIVQKTMGIDYMINPDMACAREIFRYLTENYNLTGGRFASGNTSILECDIDNIPELINKKVKETSGRLEGVLIAAISRNGKIIVPNGDKVLLKDDKLYLIGLDHCIENIAGRIRKDTQYADLKRVMIAGGGKTGYYLAKLLSEYGSNVKIIESDLARCRYLSENLDNVLVLNGDATDTNLLAEENLSEMDAFVATTGFDEENLLISLLAKQNGVPDVITKVSRNSYSELTDSLGVDAIINPLEISAANILRFIEKNGRVIFSKIIQGQAEFVEISADASMPLTKSTLSQLTIPEGVLIAAVRRDGEAFIPTGSTQIRPGDRVVIISLLSSTASLEALLNR